MTKSLFTEVFMMKISRFNIGSFLALTLMGILVFSPVTVSGQARIGKNLEEIKKLAVKEGKKGKVRMGSGLRPNEARMILKGFYRKYPGINVKATRVRGSDSRERILTEALGGLVEYDLVDVSAELQSKYIKAGVLAGPFELRRLFPRIPKIHLSPNGYFIAVGFGMHVIAYNPTLVPTDRVPKKWRDCLDPYWKGKFIVDTRPKTFATLFLGWGEAKTIEYVTQLKKNQPIWRRGQTASLALLAAGEFPMICGTYFQSINRILRRDPSANLAISIPDDVSVSMGETLAIMKGARSPNASLLLAGWLASPEGQEGYEKVGRGSPFVEGGEKRRLIREAGAKLIFRGWEEGGSEAAITKKIVSAWGFTGRRQE